MSVYKLAAVGSGGTEDGIAQLDIQFTGTITAILGTMAAGLAANGEKSAVEVSFISTNGLGTNDTRGSLFAMRQELLVGASGAAFNTVNNAVGGLKIPVGAGERIWMHIDASASRSTNAEVYLYVDDGANVQTPQRRR